MHLILPHPIRTEIKVKVIFLHEWSFWLRALGCAKLFQTTVTCWIKRSKSVWTGQCWTPSPWKTDVYSTQNILKVTNLLLRMADVCYMCKYFYFLEKMIIKFKRVSAKLITHMLTDKLINKFFKKNTKSGCLIDT